MKFNPLPFLFLPGVVLMGYILDGGSGVVWGLVLWAIPVLVGTLLNLRRHHAADARRARDDAWESASPSPMR